MKYRNVPHFEIHGDTSRPALVLLHGFMGNTRDWDPIAAILKPCFRCVVIDLPGHGKSASLPDDLFTFDRTADAIAQVMESVDAIPAPILGYSMGGRIALYLAVYHTHLCSALIMESATAGIAKEEGRKKRFVSDETWAQMLERGSFEQFLRSWYSQPVFASIAEAPETLQAVMAQRRDNDPKALARALRGFSVGVQTSLWASLSSVNVPVLLVTGKRDEKYVAICNKMTDMLPLAHVFIDENAGHNVHLESPVPFAERVKKFLKKELTLICPPCTG